MDLLADKERGQSGRRDRKVTSRCGRVGRKFGVKPLSADVGHVVRAADHVTRSAVT